ncbi:TolC family protein [Mucilaginibacter arboris]|uniref:TolC family protein n=1 Tax=Mucilaginibacter arboris TaxID=2682090 RepID=A0A7K1SXM8_9SPHI|nr:TolC family protein [Mucilaginibacter arboris]MVN22075.1 TolC family protein [Mucilaginibacter arboris]
MIHYTRLAFFYIEKLKKILFLTLGLCIGQASDAQNRVVNDTTTNLTLQQCIDYALQHQPFLQQSLINVSIARTTNRINLAAWLPQVNVAGNLTHYNELPTTYVTTTAGGTPVRQQTGVTNSFVPGLAASQALFSPNLLFVAKSAPLYIKEAKQVTDSTKINVVASVSKSFYNLLLTLEQINVLKEDTARLGKNVRDAYHQYVGGIVDETDYEQATITLSNSKVQLKQATENVVPQYASLKQLMGYQPEKQFNVSFDTLKMIQAVNLDTTQQLQYEKRIEYQIINTQKSIQDQTINYYRFAFLPSLSAFYNYNLAFYNNSFADLFSSSYPNSTVGLSIGIPIFTGFSRLNNLRRAKLQQQQIGLSEVNLRSQIYTEYTTALANYKSNLYNLRELQKNVVLAKRVYFVVTLQYQQGVVAYLNVITAESNLINSEIGYLNALFQLLSSKIDLEKAMGNITY